MERVRQRIADVITDPVTAELMMPWYSQSCKRPCFHDDYLATFNRPTVELVDTDGRGVDYITEKGVVANGIEYEIEPCTLESGINTTRVRWGEKIDGSSRAILDTFESPNLEPDDDPKDALERILREGAKDSRTVKQTMLSNGYSDKQTRKARERLNVISVRDGFGAETKTFWSLPPPP
jgi:hypothetical protein